MSRSFSPSAGGRSRRTGSAGGPARPQSPQSSQTPAAKSTPQKLPVEAGFAQPVRDYLNYCRIECGFSPATLSAYESDLTELATSLAGWGFTAWQEVEFENITAHLRQLHERGLATSSIARHVAAIRVFTRYLESIGQLEDDPCEWLTQPSTWRRLPSVLGPGQIQALLEAPGEADPYYLRDRAILEMLYASGLRASELATLVCQHLHLDLGVVRVMGKGRKERITPVGRQAIDAARAYLTELRPKLYKSEHATDAVFLSRTGRPLERVAVWQLVKKYARRAGLGYVHPHTLRHSFATHLLAGGADLRIVQELLGHSNIQTTEVYTHVDRSQLKETVRKHHPRP